MIDTKLLRQKLIDIAMRGLLVEQRQEEGNASDLLEEIRAEKAALIKKGQIKKEKPLPEIKEEEKPFTIPANWCWVRLGEIVEVARGGSPRPIKRYLTDSEDGINWIKIGDANKGDKYIERATEKIIPEGASRSRFVHKGDFLLSNSMSFGRPYILNIDGCVHDGWLVLSKFYKVLYKDFLYYLLSSSLVIKQFKNRAEGAVVDNLNSEKVSVTLIPLPSLAEQKRIVAALEASLKLVDTIAKDSVDLDKALKFLRQKVLDMAMRGLLVEQRPEEGNATDLLEQIRAEKAALIKKGQIKKEKPLPEIKEEEKPFAIPANWCWVRLGEIVINRDSERVPLAEHEREGLDKVYDYYGASGVIDKVDRYLFSERLLLIGEDGANLLTRTKPIAFIAEGFYWVNNHAHVLQNTKALELNYLCYYINSISLVKYVTGTAQPKMNQLNMNKILVPLPPLAEQKRVVAKLEQINALIETALN